MSASDMIAHLKAQLATANEECAKAGVGKYKGNYFLGKLTLTGQLATANERIAELETENATLSKEYQRRLELLQAKGDTIATLTADCDKLLESLRWAMGNKRKPDAYDHTMDSYRIKYNEAAALIGDDKEATDETTKPE